MAKAVKASVKDESSIIGEFKNALENLSDKIDAFVYPLIIPPRDNIDEDILFKIYPDLKEIGRQKKLHVLLYSYGGDAHTAFHIGRLLQDYTDGELKIYILREAKSAATLLASAADRIVFSDISELGPMDPQIFHPKVDRRFSPLAIKHVLDLLHTEFSADHTGVVNALASRLPDPITLGEALKSLDTGKDYLYKLLRARMFKGEDEVKIREIANRLVIGYPDHGYCIDFREASDIGLKVEKASPDIEHELFKLMESFKDVWNRFEYLFNVSKEPGDDDFKEAVSLLVGLREAAAGIVQKQLASESSPVDAAKQTAKITKRAKKV